MSILSFIWDVFNFLVDLSILIWVSCYILFGGKWYVGNFASISFPGLLYKSKRKYNDSVE